MKIYPDLTKLWAKRIREAGMTKNQAKKVLDENESLVEETNRTMDKIASKKSTNEPRNILKKLNIF